jgi:uncharacterized membrane protein
MLKLKSKAVEPQEEVEEETDEEMEEEVEQVKKAINTKFVRPVEPKIALNYNPLISQQAEVEEPEEVEEDNLKMTRLEILDAIDAHIIRVKQLLDIVRE